MIGDLWQRGAVRLPEIRSLIQSITGSAQFIRTQRAHAVAAVSTTVAVLAVGFAAVGYARHEERAADVQVAASRIEAANLDLQDELARLRDQAAASSRDLAAAQSRVSALVDEEKARAQRDEHQINAVEQSTTKGDKTAQLSGALHAAEAQRATLAARLSKAETDLLEQQARQNQLQGQLDQWQKKLEQLTADHDKALAERDRLKARVGELEKQSELRHAAQSVAIAQPVPAITQSAAAIPQPVPTAPAATQSAAAAPQSLAMAPAAVAATAPVEQAAPQRVAGILNAAPPAPATAAVPQAVATPQPSVATVKEPAMERGTTEQFARVLASAGVDVRHLFAEFGINRAEGGPFVPVSPGQTINPGLSSEKLVALRAMIKTLPVYAPLTEYRVTSPFGVREDPENEREGFHTGIDLAAPYDTPVYATAPGTVTYAGWRDDYGKIVEIDHGNGIATRYAHLHQITVSVGQHVVLRQQVGYLGSSGRATGPHVHYEVVVNGEPQDPEKFFALSRYAATMTVPVSARN
jgi:murein DD-endopeptidase MepM/ murein hydrolase activator NlpD